MLVAPKRSSPTETRLHFVEHQQGVVAIAPRSQRLHVLNRRKRRRAALIRLHNDSADVVRGNALAGELGLKALETRVFGPETVGKWHLNEAGIEVDDPVFQRRNPARQLRSQ